MTADTTEDRSRDRIGWGPVDAGEKDRLRWLGKDTNTNGPEWKTLGTSGPLAKGLLRGGTRRPHADMRIYHEA